MICSKKDLTEYLEADRLSLGRTRSKPDYKDLIWKYEISLRKCEYFANTKSGGYSISFLGSFTVSESLG